MWFTELALLSLLGPCCASPWLPPFLDQPCCSSWALAACPDSHRSHASAVHFSSCPFSLPCILCHLLLFPHPKTPASPDFLSLSPAVCWELSFWFCCCIHYSILSALHVVVRRQTPSALLSDAFNVIREVGVISNVRLRQSGVLCESCAGMPSAVLLSLPRECMPLTKLLSQKRDHRIQQQ